MKVYRASPTFVHALKFAKGLVDEPGINPEYERGILEFIIDLFAVEDGMDSRGELAELLGWPW